MSIDEISTVIIKFIDMEEVITHSNRFQRVYSMKISIYNMKIQCNTSIFNGIDAF